MPLTRDMFLTDIMAKDKNGKEVYPYLGERGAKKGFYSVNFSNDTNKFQPATEEQLVEAIVTGKFRDRGTIRMLPLDYKPGDERSAYAPLFYEGTPVSEYS